jgi:signal transduction histidine kinase
MGPRARRAAVGGLGIALALVKQMVDRWGGTIEVANEPGRSCFTMHLPLEAAARRPRHGGAHGGAPR